MLRALTEPKPGFEEGRADQLRLRAVSLGKKAPEVNYFDAFKAENNPHNPIDLGNKNKTVG